MITVNIYGLDQFLVGDISPVLGKDLAKIYEVDEDEINFISTNNMVFHSGMEQTSWRVFVEVNVPKKLEVLQDQAAKVIIAHLSKSCIHIDVLFHYYLQDHRVTHRNKDYPLYLEEKNVVNFESEYTEEMEEGEEEDQIYTGDIFEGLKN